MTLFIAEYDEEQQIAAVWVAEKSSRGPRVFDPKKHIFQPGASAEFFGASQDKIEQWIASAQLRGPSPR